MADNTLDEFFNVKKEAHKNVDLPKNDKSNGSDETAQKGKGKMLKKLAQYIEYAKMVDENLNIMIDLKNEAIEKLELINFESGKFYKYGIKGEPIPDGVDVHTITSIKKLYDNLEERKNTNLNDFMSEHKKLEKNIGILENDLILFNMYGKLDEASALLVQLKQNNEDYKDIIDKMLKLESEYERTKVYVNDIFNQSEKIKQEIIKNASKNLPNNER